VQELAPGIFVETGFRRINVGAILTGEGWVLIDTPPYPDDANRWREMLQSISEAPICAIVTTDCHRDRFLGNSWFDTRVLVAHSESISHIRSLPTAFVENAIESLVSDSVERSRFGSVRLRLPNVGFTRRMQLRYGGMEIPLLAMPGPTAGSLWVHLPEHGILFTGDACVNGAFNYTGDGDTASWITVLSAMAELPVKTVAPGHGEMAGKELLATQQRYFVELRAAIQKAIDAGQTLEEIKQSIQLPFYKEWTGTDVKAQVENIEHVYRELTGGTR